MEGMERQVIRCATCELNQFMTVSGLCRKCHKPLVAQPQAAAEPEAEPEPENIPADDQPITLAYVIATNIVIARARRKISQGQLAKAARIGRNTMNRAEGGVKAPTLKTLERVVLALECDFASLLPTKEQQKEIERQFPPAENTIEAEIANRVHSLTSSDRFLLLKAARSMAMGQMFITETMNV